METKKIVSKEDAELKEEDLEKVAGGARGSYGICIECGCSIKLFDSNGCICPNCGGYNTWHKD